MQLSKQAKQALSAATVSVLLVLVLSFQNCGGAGGFKADGVLTSPSLVTNENGNSVPAPSPGPGPSPSTGGNASGKAIYDSKCAACHGVLTSSAKSGATAAQIENALNTQPLMAPLRGSLTSAEIQAVSQVLSPTTGAPQCDTKVISHVGVHRLNRNEYTNVIWDMTGLDIRGTPKLPDDPYGGFYSNIAAKLGMDNSKAKSYYDLTIEILDKAFANSATRALIVTCNPSGTGERACAEQVIRQFGQKAFRRPLADAEATRLMAKYDAIRKVFPAGTSANAFDETIKGPLQALLLSHNFMYRIIELPNATPSTIKPLTNYELASRLSFFIWGRHPDATLFGVAASGSLTSPDVLAQQVDRMLKDPKAAYLVDVFASQWLNLEKLKEMKPDHDVYPEFNEGLRKAMQTETKMLLGDVIQRDGSPYLLLTANYTYVNDLLAAHYKMPAPGSYNFVRANLPNNRVGLLTHGSLLTVNAKPGESSIVQRGLWALGRLLCTNVGAAPADAPKLEEGNPVTTNPRKTLEAHGHGDCKNCHKQIDPSGFGLENFDGVGKYRETYRNGDVVDASGQFPDSALFVGARELGAVLAQNPKFQFCTARNLMTFSLGRELTDGDVCAADTIGYHNVKPTGKFSDLVKSIVMSDQFLKQRGGN